MSGSSRFAEVAWVPTTGSTNADLAAVARSGGGEQALVADVQEAGRGRRGRRWEAPAGASLLMSVLVRPPLPVSGANLVGTALGLAAADAVEDLAGVALVLKWPNDVVTGAGVGVPADRKVGGLLAELVDDPGDPAPGPAVVAGIGLNVAWAAHGFPEEIAATAASLDQLGAEVDRRELVTALLGHLERHLGDGDQDACGRMVERYRDRCATLGRRVRVEMPTAELVGTALDVADDGALVVRGDDATLHTVTVGDVVHLRDDG